MSSSSGIAAVLLPVPFPVLSNTLLMFLSHRRLCLHELYFRNLYNTHERLSGSPTVTGKRCLLRQSSQTHAVKKGKMAKKYFYPEE